VQHYKGKPSRELPSDVSQPEDLNAFYAHYEASNSEPCMKEPAVTVDCVIMRSIADMSRTFKRVNIHKAAGPDRLPRRVHKACTDQMASVFTDIFNLSLTVFNTYMFQADHYRPGVQEYQSKLSK
jgi:hypothetical protein